MGIHKILLASIITAFGIVAHINSADFYLTVLGLVQFEDGIGRQAIGIIDCLKDDISINFINTRMKQKRRARHNTVYLDEIPDTVRKIIERQEPGYSLVAILEDVLTNGNQKAPEHYYQLVPPSLIKLAYSMFESTQIPADWSEILNNNFDAVVVPDQFLVEVYQKSGVTIPIFVLPLGVYVEHFLELPNKIASNNPFVFGFSGAFSARKNHMVLLQSFAQEFGNNPQVILKIHGRFGDEIYDQLKQTIEDLHLTNVQLIKKRFTTQEYFEFMTSLDCYVSISRGEGFGVTPREALAIGIPCIVTDNTAQKTICDSGFVRTVASDIAQPAYYGHLGQYVGDDFNCTIADVVQALRDVYENYNDYLHKAHRGRAWAAQYVYPHLKAQYLNLVKPKKVILGDQNNITDEYLMTNSKNLFDKYLSIGAQSYRMPKRTSVQTLIDNGTIHQCFESNGTLLRLSHKHLSSLDGLENVPHAEHIIILDLSHNDIMHLSPHHFERFKSLGQLWLSNNKVKNFSELSEINNLENLRELHIDHNEISIFSDSFISNFPWLYILNLSHNQIHTLLPEPQLTQSNRLEALYLNDNQIQTLPPHIFSSFIHLRALYLQNNCIKRADIRCFKELKELTLLLMYNNLLSIIKEGAFSDLHNLYLLNLCNNTIENLDHSCFNGLNKIRIIDLSANNLSTTAQNMLHNLYPSIYI